MNIHLKPLVLAAVALAGSLVIASADPVTFNVNLSVQTQLGNFNADNGDVVALMGLGGDWVNGLAMSPAATPGVYTLTTSLTALSWPNYRYVIKPAGGSWIWEAGDDNRWFQVPSGGTNLPTVYFNNLTSVPPTPVTITFHLGMDIAILEGKFNPGFDYVNAFGSFDSWGTTGVLLTNVPNTSNYVGALTSSAIPTNSVVQYKFAINGFSGTWEGNVGPNGAQNRSITVTSTNVVVPLSYWNNITSLSSTSRVSFSVNMAAQNALGTFTPGIDFVFASGDWDWSGTALQLAQVDFSDVYTGSVDVILAPGSTADYKFSINAGWLWENDGVGSGGARNRQFVVNATNLPTAWFNNVQDLGPLLISQAGDQTTLSWPAGTNFNHRIRLQSSPSPATGWLDIPDALGQSTISSNFGSGPIYFRLVGP